MHFSDATQDPYLVLDPPWHLSWPDRPSQIHLFLCPVGGYFKISTADILGRREQLDRVSIGSWFPWKKAALFLNILLPRRVYPACLLLPPVFYMDTICSYNYSRLVVQCIGASQHMHTYFYINVKFTLYRSHWFNYLGVYSWWLLVYSQYCTPT